MTEAIKLEAWVLLQWGLPLFVILGTAILLLLVAAFRPLREARLVGPLTFLAIAGALLLSIQRWLLATPLVTQGLVWDRLSYCFDLLFLLCALLVFFLSRNDSASRASQKIEYFVLLLFALTGAMLMSHGGTLIILFLSLEISALSTYVLTAMRKDSASSYEAGLKYFLMGSIASGFLLYGIAMAYGAAGSTSLQVMKEMTLSTANLTLVKLASALFIIGLGFKIAAVPFHSWAPDVYEGAPTPITAFMASVTKAAGFVALIRIVTTWDHIVQVPWSTLMGILAALTMTIGNLAALRQTNIKRLLAYSSIAHAGYALVGVAAALHPNASAESTWGAVIFYLFAYSFMTIGAFAVVIAISRKSAEELSDFSGLAKNHPYLSAAMATFLLGLTGIPPTVGFVGKFFVFSGAVEVGLYVLVVIAVLNSAISAAYYLGPIIKMYFQSSSSEFKLPALSYNLLLVIFFCFFLVLYLGIFPSEIFLMARESVRELMF